MKKLLSLVLVGVMALSLAACGGQKAPQGEAGGQAQPEAGATYTVGLCNYVNDASLDQIVENIKAQLEVLGAQYGCTFVIKEDNCQADATVLTQIVDNFVADNVDLMIGVATPVAMQMQAATEDNQIPVIFSAVSDPLATGLVASLEAPGANVTGTSDYLDTSAIMNLIFQVNPEADYIGLLYDQGQDSSTTAIAEAKAYLDANGIRYVEKTGTTTDEVMLAADALVLEGVDAVFTPTDNTIMTAELSIYEKFADAGILHYTGADSFALNGAFLGYGVDYANLGKETANMVAAVLCEGQSPATLGVMTFDNGTASVNTDTITAVGLDIDTIVAILEPFCTQVNKLVTAESFN